MATKAELLARAKEKGLEVTGDETVAELTALLKSAPTDSQDTENGSDTSVPNVTTSAAEVESLKDRIAELEQQLADAKEKPKGRSGLDEALDAKKTADAMKAELEKQERVPVYVPLEQGEKKGTQLPVEINGYRVNVPKGVLNVMVPKAVAEIIWQSLGIYEEASAALRSQNDPERPMRMDLQSDSDLAALGV